VIGMAKFINDQYTECLNLAWIPTNKDHNWILIELG
jgi:hypothetical protein